MERRALQIELRAAGSNPRRLEGYAAVFDTETKIGDFVETIARGAFAQSLSRGSDILALVDHQPDKLLGRTRSGTLRLAEDSRGLHFEIDAPDTTLGRDVLALAERGDIGGASFGFRVPKGGDAWAGDRRELRSVVLLEVSIVSAWPAYTDTHVEARSRRRGGAPDAGLRRALERWRA
jgi:HK97 family phage prohead protease